MKKIIAITLIMACVCNTVKAQDEEEINAITTAAPFLLITPDARAGGMGDVGVSSSADANSFHHNPAKYAFIKNQMNVGVNYTPWMRELVDDVFLGNVNFSNRISDRAAWAGSLRYFTLGTISLTDNAGGDLGVEKPNELAISGTYALKLSETYSMGVSMRYIRSDFSTNVSNNDIQAINTFSVDVSGYYQSEEKSMGDFNGRWRGGFNISNIGPKVSYSPGGQEYFIPTNLKLGVGFDFIFDDYNKLGINTEFAKLLVPTPPIIDADGNLVGEDSTDTGFVEGIFQSFGDAPGGFSEELKEITYGIGAEYSYNDAFALRAGYFKEHVSKGRRNYATFGLGAKFNVVSLDLSYLFNLSDVNNPLENTLRFSAAFNFGDLFEDY